MKGTIAPILPLLSVFFIIVQACGGGDDGDKSPAKGGKSGGAAGKGGAAVIEKGSNIDFSKSEDCSGAPPFKDQNCLNIYCPDVNATPSLNEAGDCCKRVDLKKANEEKASDEKVYEYRIMSTKVLTQPTTNGSLVVDQASATRYDKKAIIILLRYTGDLTKEGEIKYEHGGGIYNCDENTYSFYDKGTAPTTGAWSTDADRFISYVTTGTWHPNDGRIDVTLENLRKGLSVQPAYDFSKSDFPLASEYVNRGLAMLKFPVTSDNLDCVGARTESAWDIDGIFESYVPMDINDKITNILGLSNQAQTACQFTAFFALPAGDETKITCNMERCDPATDASCRWRELPDSLCPKDSDEEKIFPCHLGNEKTGADLIKACNDGAYTDLAPKQWCERLKKWPEPFSLCSKTAPTSISDRPQCCDPLGQSSEIPPCNSWRVVYKFSAASVDITDKPTKSRASNCQ